MINSKHIKVISGGQTGVDRAALEAARNLDLDTGGWAPKLWRTENGPDPSLASFGLKQTATSNYTVRTRKNVCDADATVIIRRAGVASPGSILTERIARENDKPCLTVALSKQCDVGEMSAALDRIISFLESVLPKDVPVVVNFAGNRESSSPGIGEQANQLISATMLGMVEFDEEEDCFVRQHGADALAAKEAELVEKVGWYIHFVVDGKDFNIHTHHVLESFGHTDLQITIGLQKDTAMEVLQTVVNKIKAGQKFTVGNDYEGIIGKGYKVRFINATVGGRQVLRLIFPDADGNLDRAEMKQEYFANQYDNLQS